MPDQAPVIGGVASAFLPNVTAEIALGWTSIRFYWATTETATATLVSTQALVAGTKDYSYNKTDAAATDWFEWRLYNGTTEGPASERLPIGPPRITRTTVRQGAGRRLGICEFSENTTFTDGDTFAITDFNDPDESAYRFANWYARMFEGDEVNEVRPIRSATAAPAGYVPNGGTFNLGRAFSGTPSTGEGVELWRPNGRRDPSKLIDEAMQRARFHIWFEETFLFAADASVTEYAMPDVMLKDAIKAVEYAAGTYPSEPYWRPVGWWSFRRELGTPYLSVKPSAMEDSGYSSGQVMRVIFNRIPDRMDNESDWWPVAEEWAIAEVAYEYLKTIALPGGAKDDVSDAERAKGNLAEDIERFRSSLMPDAVPQMVLPS